MNILEEIAAKTTERIRKEKEAIPLSTLRSAAEKRPEPRNFSLRKL